METALIENDAPAASWKSVASLAGFALLRIAALPNEAVTALTPVKAPIEIDALLAAERQMEALRQPLEDALYAAVPQLDRCARAELLALRRAVHNGRACAKASEQKQILQTVSERAAEMLDRWLASTEKAARAGAEAQRLLDEEIETRLRPGLRALAQNPEFQRGLVMASPELFEAIKRNEWKNRTERSIFSYAMRAATKTSPFSVFMHQAVLVLEPGSDMALPRLHRSERTSRSYLNSGITTELNRRRAKAYVVNPFLRWVEKDLAEIAGTRYIVVSGRLWRSETPARVRLHPRVAEVLRAIEGEFCWHELPARLVEAGLTSGRAVSLASKLLEKGAFIPARPNEAREGLAQMREMAAQVAGLGAESRIRVIQQIRQLASPGGLNMVLEDSGFHRAYGPVGGEFTELLSEMGYVLADAVSMRSHYAKLRGLFLRCFGRDEVCTDVAGFLNHASEQLKFGPLAQASGPDPDSERGGRAGATVFFQLATSENESLAVINQVHTGCGWLSARYASGEDKPSLAVRRSIAEWLQRIKAPAEPVDFSVCADCNPLQTHPLVTARSLIWPGEPEMPGGFPVSETTLKYNPGTGLLELFDRNGSQVAPVYLGGTLPSVLWGGRYWMTVLAEPFGVKFSAGSVAIPRGESEFEHRGRCQRGRIVLNRESWWVKSERLNRTWFHNVGVRRIADVARDSAALGLPRVFFARSAMLPKEMTATDAHKPLWVDTMNPLCLDLLEFVARRADWVVFTEVLPALDAGFSPFEGAAHVSEFMVEMVIGKETKCTLAAAG
jgi:hypothetical protein